MIDSTNPRSMADNIRKLWDKFKSISGDLLPSRFTATTGQILKLTGETKTPAWADEYSYTPPAYSETEVNTGQKWIDGKNIYCKVYDNITVPSPASTQTIDENFSCSDFVYGYCMFDTSDGKFVTYGGNGVFVHTNGSLRSYITSASYLGATGKIVVFYTKPDPTPGRAPEDSDQEPEPEVVGATPDEMKELEAEEKKTTKKKTTK